MILRHAQRAFGYRFCDESGVDTSPRQAPLLILHSLSLVAETYPSRRDDRRGWGGCPIWLTKGAGKSGDLDMVQVQRVAFDSCMCTQPALGARRSAARGPDDFFAAVRPKLVAAVKATTSHALDSLRLSVTPAWKC